jgi:AcrR family transcriptional regulator
MTDCDATSSKLTPRQKKVLPFLLSHPVERACAEAGISKQSVYRWLKDDAFKNELERLRDETFERSLQRIKDVAGLALDKLIELLEAPKADVRARAAENLLEYAFKIKMQQDLEQRLTVLEAAIGRSRF